MKTAQLAALLAGLALSGAVIAQTVTESAGVTSVEGAAPTLEARPDVAEDVLFDNFAAGDAYDAGYGYTLGFGSDLRQGETFTVVGGDFRLDSIELAVGRSAGTNKLTVDLMTDAAGEPGTVIESFLFTNEMGSFGDLNPPLFAASVDRPMLTSGTQYWLVARTPVTTTWAAWNINSVGDVGPHAFREGDTGAWDIGNATRGAFRINGSMGGDDICDLGLIPFLLGCIRHTATYECDQNGDGDFTIVGDAIAYFLMCR